MSTQKPTILVTGSAGQLGNELRVLSGYYSSLNFLFTSRGDVNFQDTESIGKYLRQHKPAYCINCAAYTAVDKAESEKDLAFTINAEAVGVLAKVCTELKTRLI